MKRLTLIFPLVLLIAAVGFLPACGASGPTIPTGPPIIKSFTVEDDTIEPGEAPKFSFEVANTSSITIRQDGEVVFEIEVTGSEGASVKPLGNVAYALPADGAQPDRPWPAGIYPVIYKGATSGHAATCVWEFGDEEQHEVTAEMEVRSPSGEKATQFIEMYMIATEQKSDQRTNLLINEFTIKNAEGIAGEPVEFVIDVSNPSVITIERDSNTGTSFQKGETIFRQEFTSDAGCPFDFKATVTGPPPTQKGQTVFYRLTVTDGSGQKVFEDRSLDVCAFR